MGLLDQQNRFDEIDHVAQVLRDQGAALDEITIVKALDAIRKQDFDRGIALARQVFPETSTNYSDHLTLGRFYMTAGRSDEAGKEFQRAVALGPGVPESWLAYVQYLVQAKRFDQAKAVIEAARRSPARRSGERHPGPVFVDGRGPRAGRSVDSKGPRRESSRIRRRSGLPPTCISPRTASTRSRST